MDPHIEQLHRQQDAVIEQMRQLRLVYRGTLSEQQYPERQARREGSGATGPYFLWQGTTQGKRFGLRVDARRAQRIREGIEARHRFEALCAQFVAIGEALADYVAKMPSADTLKKRRNRRRNERGGSAGPARGAQAGPDRPGGDRTGRTRSGHGRGRARGGGTAQHRRRRAAQGSGALCMRNRHALRGAAHQAHSNAGGVGAVLAQPLCVPTLRADALSGGRGTGRGGHLPSPGGSIAMRYGEASFGPNASSFWATAPNGSRTSHRPTSAPRFSSSTTTMPPNTSTACAGRCSTETSNARTTTAHLGPTISGRDKSKPSLTKPRPCGPEIPRPRKTPVHR